MVVIVKNVSCVCVCVCMCEKAAVYELLRTAMVGVPVRMFTRYHEKDITRIKSHMYGEWRKLTKHAIGHYANSLYIHYSGDVMPCGKDRLVANEKPFDRNSKFPKDVLKGKVSRFMQVDIEVTKRFYDKFSGMALLFVVQEIPDCHIPKTMKIYKETSGRETVKGTKKLLGVMKAKNTLLSTPRFTAICKMV